MMSDLDPISQLPDDSFGVRLRAWTDQRGALSAREEGGEHVYGDEWATADDDGVELLAEASDSLLDLAVMDVDMWRDNAGHFSCTEANALAGLLTLLYGEEVAASFARCHADSDDEGDQHFGQGHDGQ